MQRNSMNQDNDRFGSNDHRQMNRGYDNDQHRTDRQRIEYSDRSRDHRDDETGYGGSQYSGYRGTDDRSHRSYGYDDRGFSGSNDERHPHDEHERGRWGSDYANQRGHRYQGGMIDDRDRFRRDEADFQRSGYSSHGVYDRNRTGSRDWQGDRHRMHHEEYPNYDRPQYQDRDNHGRFNDTSEGRRFTSGNRDDDRYRMDRDDRSRYGTDDNRRYGHPGYGYENQSQRYGQNQDYGRGGYGRDDRRFDEQRGYGGSVSNDHRSHDDHDRRWSGGGYEEDRRGRGRGRY